MQTRSRCDTLAASYAAGASEGGHDIRCVALRELEFDLVLRGGFHNAKPLEPDITEQQELIQWCEPLVVVSLHHCRCRYRRPLRRIDKTKKGSNRFYWLWHHLRIAQL